MEIDRDGPRGSAALDRGMHRNDLSNEDNVRLIGHLVQDIFDRLGDGSGGLGGAGRRQKRDPSQNSTQTPEFTENIGHFAVPPSAFFSA